MNEQIVTALDIGSSKIFAVSGIVRETMIEVISAEVAYPADEIVRKGRVVDMEGLSNALYDLFQSMKKQTGEKVEWVVMGLGGGHVQGTLYQRRMAIEPKGREIATSDIQSIERDIRTEALAVQAEQGRRILEVTAEEYIVDAQGQSRKSPVGRHGHTLETKMHILTAEANPVQDLVVCARNAGVEVERVVPSAWAVAGATVNEEERKLGCLVMDIGKGTTDIAFYLHDALVHTESLPFGGGSIDGDISFFLHTPPNYAEELKKNHSWCTVQAMVADKDARLHEAVEIFTPTGKVAQKVTTEKVSLIVLDRVLDIYKRVKEALDPDPEAKTRLIDSLSGGIILSGGSCRLKGLPRLTEDVFGHPTRIGCPKQMQGLDKNLLRPEFAAGIGLLLSATHRQGTPESLFTRIKKKVLNIF